MRYREKCSNGRVEVFVKKFRQLKGYDLRVIDPAATIGDYLQVMEEAIACLPLSRLWHSVRRGKRECYGCDSCCWERLPLTIIDFFQLQKALIQSSVQVTGINDFLKRYGYVVVEGRVVDISLARPEGACIFLDRASHTCKVYDYRPLVCRTFICCPSTRRAQSLRSILTNKGMDELVRLWLKEKEQGIELVVHFSRKPAVRERDWPATVFAGHDSYEQIPLRRVLPLSLWQILCLQA